MNICLNLVLISLSILLLVKAANTLLLDTLTVFPLDSRSKASVGTTGVEEPEERTSAHVRYDVNAFNKRIMALREEDENGLFDMPFIPPATDFTGTEIADES